MVCASGMKPDKGKRMGAAEPRWNLVSLNVLVSRCGFRGRETINRVHVSKFDVRWRVA